jgi:hypothetical protein
MQTTAVRIIHDFCDDPEFVRNSALQAGFGTWRPNKGEVGSSNYDGMNFWGRHSMMIHALSKAMGCQIFPNNTFFRVTNKETEKAYVHSDRESGTHTCVAYLSEHDGLSGTGFFRHRGTGMTRMPSFAELATNPTFFDVLKKEMVEGTEEHWELIDFVRGQFNKAIIFDAPLFHARHPKNGFGETPEEGRMVWVCHFCLADAAGNLISQSIEVPHG